MEERGEGAAERGVGGEGRRRRRWEGVGTGLGMPRGAPF